jgi:uncharacterized DUF497 family protein
MINKNTVFIQQFIFEQKLATSYLTLWAKLPYKLPYFYIDAIPFWTYYKSMNKRSDFEWDSNKDALNQEKHGVSFALAQLAFLDHKRVILEDFKHGGDNEKRFYCLGRSLQWNYDRTIYLSQKQNQNYWRRILTERQENI